MNRVGVYRKPREVTERRHRRLFDDAKIGNGLRSLHSINVPADQLTFGSLEACEQVAVKRQMCTDGLGMQLRVRVAPVAQ